ncbi:MAG: DNA replication and repair protein RecF [Actinomycetota bacterium]|nr:DNA replication and repair protein RecF [Actinomycetota bacterium]
MLVTSLRLRDFRNYCEARVDLGERLTLVHGPNGAGKTNLLEGLYFGCTGRSCRTVNEREVVRFGAGVTRVEVSVSAEDGEHELTVGFSPGEPKRIQVDGAATERMLDAAARPLVSVFLPDRLELVKGAPTLRRAHLDQFVAAMWPARRSNRKAYAQALAHRNALISRIRAGDGSRAALATWTNEVARHGLALMGDRDSAVRAINAHFGGVASELGLDGDPALRYRPRSQATEPAQLAAELELRLDSDLDRGFTSHGPHRDDLLTLREGRDLRAYGSQGQQRLALLSLLLAERQALAEVRDAPPLMLLDDVMSELDHGRREALIDHLRASGGQALITTTELDQVPVGADIGVVRLPVAHGAVLAEAIG